MFKIIHQGVEIHCETADEAIEIAAKLRGAPFTPKKGAHAGQGFGGSRWTASRFRTFCSLLQDKQRKFLREVLKSTDGVTATTLRQSLSLSSNKAFGPILTAISRKAKKVGVSLQDVLTSEKILLSSGERVLEFKAAPSFAGVAEQAGGIE